MADDKTPATPVEPVATTPATPVEPVTTPAPASGEFTDQELAELNSQMENAQKQIVSEEVSKLLETERATAKAEAAKEFETNQRIKELEAEKAQLAEQRIADQKAAAEQLAALKEKVDSLAASRAVVSADNPFTKPPEEPEKGFDVETAAPEVIDEIERNSMEAFFEQKRRMI